MRDGQPKEKRLHEGGVGPEMRSPAGLNPKDSTAALVTVNGVLLTGESQA